MYPTVLLRAAATPRDAIPLLVGLDSADNLLGYHPVDDTIVEQWSPMNVIGLVSFDPAAVYFGVQVERAQQDLALVANRRRRYAPRGQLFLPLPEGELSGFPAAEPVLRRHRMTVPSVDTVRVCALFAVNTVRIRIELAERQFDCFGALYRQHGREMPPLEEVRECFLGMQNVRTEVFREVAEYAPTIRDAIAHGYRDRELRHLLAMDTETPDGLGLAKLSFVLALLGQDTICLDGRLLGRMFANPKDRAHFEKVISKREGRYTQVAIDAYEGLEDAFLTENPHYNPNDPIGRARAQWQSWEGVGRKRAEHRVWMNLLPA